MYNNCTEAFKIVRNECGTPESKGYANCMREKNVQLDSKLVRECRVATQCNVAGYTVPYFACTASDVDSPKAQTVYGMPLQGGPTRVSITKIE